MHKELKDLMLMAASVGGFSTIAVVSIASGALFGGFVYLAIAVAVAMVANAKVQHVLNKAEARQQDTLEEARGLIDAFRRNYPY